MGLFGLLLTAISGGVVFADTCRVASEERQSREKAENTGARTWIDNKGCTRLVGTNEKCYHWDKKLISLKDGRVIFDYEAERIKNWNAKKIAEAKAEGKKYAWLIYPEISKVNGVWYLTELETGKRYYLIHSRFTKDYIKGYYGRHEGIGTALNKREDEKIKLTEEEYKEWGGYTFQEYTGVYHENFDGKVIV